MLWKETSQRRFWFKCHMSTDASDWNSQVTWFKRAEEWVDRKLRLLAANSRINSAWTCDEIYHSIRDLKLEKSNTAAINVKLWLGLANHRSIILESCLVLPQCLKRRYSRQRYSTQFRGYQDRPG